MRTFWRIVLCLIQVAASVVYGAEPVITIDGKPLEGVVKVEITTRQPEPESPSPTGREPRVIWSTQWQARWQKALADGHPWTEWLKTAVAKPDTAYFDKELYPAVLFQITGDPAHARQAWAKMAEKTLVAPTSDGLRANFLTWVVLSEWIYPALTEAERAQWSDHLDRCCLQAADVALGDSDRVISYYLSVATWAALGSETAQGVLASERFVAARQKLSEWAVLAKGGEWLEGSIYSRGTTPTLLEGLACLRDLGVEDQHPELWAVVPDFATAAVHRMTSDLGGQMQWGAISPEWSHGLYRPDFLLPGWATMAELGDNDALRAQIAGTVERGGRWLQPRAAFFLNADPFAQTRSPSPNPSYLVVPGQQMLFARSSWAPDATCVMFRCGRHCQVDHPSWDCGNFEMYRRGEWVARSVQSYDDLGNDAGNGAHNSLLLANQPLNFVRKEMLGAGETNGVYYLVLATGGKWYYGDQNRATEYLHSHTRWLVWIPGETDVILVRDVLDVDQPADNRVTWPKAYNRGSAKARHAAYMASQVTAEQIPLVQAVFHAPVEPTIVANGVHWFTPGGQPVALAAFYGRETPKLINEADHYGGSVSARECAWQVRFIPAGFTGGQVEMVHVIVVGAGVPVSLDGQGVRVGGKLVSFLPEGVEVSQ